MLYDKFIDMLHLSIDDYDRRFTSFGLRSEMKNLEHLLRFHLQNKNFFEKNNVVQTSNSFSRSFFFLLSLSLSLFAWTKNTYDASKRAQHEKEDDDEEEEEEEEEN